MRKLFVSIALVLWSFYSFGQITPIKPIKLSRYEEFGGKKGVRQTVLGMGFAFLSGVSTGVKETVIFHPDKFERRFPNADPAYWYPPVSWKNKYNDRNNKLGPAYPGSTTYLAWTTDLYHLTATTSRGTLVLASATFVIGEKKKWWVYATRLLAGGVAHSAGFHGTYALYF